jgi:HSP20 family protein
MLVSLLSWDEEFWRWFRRRPRFTFFSDRFFEEMDRMMEAMLKEVANWVPRDMVRERKLPDGSTIREMGPIVYGYSMKVGPDGRPIIREFGNLKPSTGRLGPGEPRIQVAEKREPLVDIMDEGETIKIIAEVPGVEKQDIQVNCSERSMTISVDTPERKYYKELELPADVDPETSRASYKNGVLEVIVRKTRPRVKGREVKID